MHLCLFCSLPALNFCPSCVGSLEPSQKQAGSLTCFNLHPSWAVRWTKRQKYPRQQLPWKSPALLQSRIGALNEVAAAWMAPLCSMQGGECWFVLFLQGLEITEISWYPSEAQRCFYITCMPSMNIMSQHTLALDSQLQFPQSFCMYCCDRAIFNLQLPAVFPITMVESCPMVGNSFQPSLQVWYS